MAHTEGAAFPPTSPDFLLIYFQDDATALDLPTMRRWNLVLRVFMSEYLHLRPEDTTSARPVRRSNAELVRPHFPARCEFDLTSVNVLSSRDGRLVLC